MSIRFTRVGFGLVLAASGVALACSSSTASQGPGGDDTGGFGNTPNYGGAGNTQSNGGAGNTQTNGGTGNTQSNGGTGSGGVSQGGSTSTANISIVGSVTTCSDTPTGPLPSGDVAACSITGCSAAHCIPTANIPPGQDTELLATCSDGSFCVPDDYIATQAKFLAKTCTSLLGAEGRCISTCVPQVNRQLTTLPKDNCADTELCAPCYNPIDGADTHACSQGCDTGPSQPKKVFTECGGGAGVCVPSSLVPADLQTPLKNVDDPTGKCTETDKDGVFLCAPKKKAADLNYVFPSCKPSLAVILGQATGGCVPKYLIPSSKQALVAKDDCTDANSLCAPCQDPTANPPTDTGACSK